MAWPIILRNLSISFVAMLSSLAAMLTELAAETGVLRKIPVAALLAGLFALVLATGFAAAGISMALNASPLPLVNTAAFVFLIASTVVSSHIVYAFWCHLRGELNPVEIKPVPVERLRPPRPLRDIRAEIQNQ